MLFLKRKRLTQLLKAELSVIVQRACFYLSQIECDGCKSSPSFLLVICQQVVQPKWLIFYCLMNLKNTCPKSVTWSSTCMVMVWLHSVWLIHCRRNEVLFKARQLTNSVKSSSWMLSHRTCRAKHQLPDISQKYTYGQTVPKATV